MGYVRYGLLMLGALALSACSTAATSSATAFVTAMKTAQPGCTEKVHLEGGAASGQIGGEGHLSGTYDRNCAGQGAPQTGAPQPTATTPSPSSAN